MFKANFLRLLIVLILMLPGRSFGAIVPDSGVRVDIRSAEILNLNCSRRRFAMENTKAITQWYPYMAQEMVTKGWDIRPIIGGVLGMIMMVPLTVLAVPSDFLASPFRRECGFELRMHGQLGEWAGRGVGGAELSGEARNLTRKGVIRRRAPEYFTVKAQTVSKGNGDFSIAMVGHVGRSNFFDIKWKVRGQPAGSSRLSRHGKTFILGQLDPGFGVGVFQSPPINITPK